MQERSMKDCKGRIHSIESFSVKDGEGIRSVVFMQGCMLRCIYCHNPDTWRREGGYEITAESLADKISRFRSYFKNGGGVTLSGGEPLLQPKFVHAFLEICKKQEIHTLLDTAGVVLTEDVKKCLEAADGVLLDFKFFDDEDYRKYTGGRLSTFFAFLNECERLNKPVTLRTVIVPNLNDNERSISKYWNAVKRYRMIQKYELLPFHTMGFQKYQEQNIENPLASVKGLENEKFLHLSNFLQSLRQ